MLDHRVWTVAATQLRLMGRDRRLVWLTSLLALVMLASVATGQARNSQQQRERAVAASEARRVWESQGPTNPHGAAHFGYDVYAPVSPLAALDPGLTDQLGVSVRLEGHSQNPARERPVEGGAAVSRFAGFSPAWALKILAPLMIILAGFSVFSGERSRELLGQELASGAPPLTLMAGQMIALGSLALALVSVFTAGGLMLLTANGGLAQDYVAAMAIGGGYLLYLLTFVGLTLAASAAFRTARAALVTLLCFWALSSLLAPRLAPALAEQLHPTPTAPSFEKAVSEEAKNGVSGHDPADKRLEAFKAETLRRYGVAREEDLPVNFAGLALHFGERNSTATYNRHYAQLFASYEGQARVHRIAALLAPELAVTPLSMAFASSDLGAHLDFLAQAEAYRYELIQSLNADVVRNKPPEDGPYLTDVGRLTRDMRFEPRRLSLGEVWSRQSANGLILGGWMIASFILAGAAATRMGRPK